MSDKNPRLTWLAVAAFASMMSLRLCDPMLPRLAADFGIGLADAAGVVTYYAIAYGLCQLVHGPVADRFGKLQVVGASALLAGAGSLACALAPDAPFLELARLFTGGFAAAVIPMSFAFVGDSFAYSERQVVLARLLTATALGLISGQIAGGLFADTLGWRVAFVVPALLFSLAGGMILYGLRGAALAPSAPAQAADGPFGVYLAVARVPWARIMMLTVMLEALFAYGSLAFIPTYLHQRFGVDLWLAGLTVAAFGVGGLIYANNAARLVRRLGETGLSRVGSVLLGVGLVLLVVAPSMAVATLATLLFGLGYQMLHGTLQTNATQMTPQYRGTAVSMFALSLFFGQSVGVALAAQAVTRGSLELVFVASALASCGIGITFSIVLRWRGALQSA